MRVEPALTAGTIVLLDRFFLSTYAYQIAGRGLIESDVRSANMMATDGLVPDLTRVAHACRGCRARARGPAQRTGSHRAFGTRFSCARRGGVRRVRDARLAKPARGVRADRRGGCERSADVVETRSSMPSRGDFTDLRAAPERRHDARRVFVVSIILAGAV